MFSPLFISTTNKKFFTPLVVAVHHTEHVLFWIGVIIAFTEQAQPWHRYGMGVDFITIIIAKTSK